MKTSKLSKLSTVSHLVKAFAALPIPVLLILMFLFMNTPSQEVFESPQLLLVLNLFFLLLIPACIVYITINAYLSSGSMGVLGLSCGAFCMGLSASAVGFLIGGIDCPNRAVTVYNMGFLLAGAFYCGGAVVVLTGVEPESSPKRKKTTIAALYLGMIFFMGLWIMATVKGLTPVFFVQGTGTTLIRQVVLGGAVGLFVCAAGLTGLLYLRSRNRFQYWYGLGLFLIAIGLFCVLLPKTVGGPIGWLGRSAQYFGAIYLLVAVLSALRDIRTRGMALGEGISSIFQHRMEKLVAERTRELTVLNERLKQEISQRRRAEEALQKANDELEIRVEERSAALVQEIKEREKTQILLQDSYNRYKGIFDNTRNGVAVYQAIDNGKDFVFLEFNRAGEVIDQVDSEDLIGRRVTEMFPGIAEFGLLEILRRVWRTGTAERYPVSSYKDGRISGWRENYVYKVATGEIVAVYSDETKRKQAEESLERERTQLLCLFDGMPAVVDVVDPLTHEVLFMNRYTKDIFGDDGVGKPCYEIFHRYDSPCSFCNNSEMLMKEAGEILQWEDFNERSDRHFMTTNTMMIWTDGRKVKFQLSIDISASKKAEADREKMQAQLHQAQRMESIGVLAGGVAHDFNNLLTAVIGNAQLVLAELPKNDPLREDIEEIRKAGERGAMLTRQLLTFSRREPSNTEVLDLKEVVQDMNKLLRRLVMESIELRTIPAAEPWKIQADVGQMEQVIMNLAVNARDVMPNGGTISIETANVELDGAFFKSHGMTGVTGQYVMLAVTDTGPGMDENIMERIFDPFFTTKERGAGTGLGLSVVYGIVKQCKGYIWPYSEPGKGTIMKVYFPRVEAVPTPKPKEETVYKETGGSEGVLVVEDDAPLRGLVVKSLQKAGYEVLTAEDGEAALQVMEAFKGKIHLLLTDVVMPKMGGRELAKWMRTLYPEVKVLYMSGFPDRGFLDPSLEPGTAFIEKPFSPEDLCRKVREAIED